MATLILVVEDDPLLRKLITGFLSKEGYAVAEAEDGGVAVELAAQIKPRLIILDMSVPVLTGYELARRFKADPGTSNTPILALTAHSTAMDRDAAFEAGCDLFEAKPIDTESLLAKVRDMVGEP